MAKSRKQAWLRDELILALDLYRREGKNPLTTEIAALSRLLRAHPIELELAADPSFRNENSVRLKIFNLVALDPTAEIEGMARGGAGDVAVFEEFANDRARLANTAEGIRRTIQSPEAATYLETEIIDAPEGELLTRVHRVRERSRSLVRRRVSTALDQRGELTCEACGFDFSRRYGSRGEGFIECHHTRPVSSLMPGERTRLEDLALVCANCHRMIHAQSPWLTVDELRALIAEIEVGSAGRLSNAED